MSIETWIAFVIASLILTMTPGPSILLGVVHSLNFGVKKTVYTALGDITANFLQMILVAIGLGVIIASSELAFLVIKWFGVITLLYMGIKMIMSKPQIIENTKQESISRKKMFTSGFVVAAGNPKAIIFFTAFFPQFIDPQQSLLLQMSILCPTMALLDFTWVMIYAISANKFFDRFQSNASYINKFSGSALIGASGFLAMSSKSGN
ncbi:LysE family translocator [Poseidonibacter lekithochrous]|uniref:LysE family translocator n=1 Tax=Poseidonibacter lekithochrous TaxID=1904463 RepID=UPI0008FC2CA5|nr:LysE family translocator [Poseidonibacter lekithochrous]QKJ23374.1 transporter, LysE family [Poseidonibacter lekithochrous]